MARKYTMRSKEEKLAIVKAVLAGRPAQYYENNGIADHHTVMRWVKKYQEEGENGLEQKRKPGNPLARYERRKELTYEEQLQYQIELLKRDLLKKDAEVARLKKQNERKGGGCPRKLFSRSIVRFKSSPISTLSENCVLSTLFPEADIINGLQERVNRTVTNKRSTGWITW